MSGDGLNAALWEAVNYCGWGWWLPLIPAAGVALYYLYQLSPAETGMGRLIRVLLTLACVCLIFIPAFNALGTVAIHLLVYSVALICRQQYRACVKHGKITEPVAETKLGRVAERLVSH